MKTEVEPPAHRILLVEDNPHDAELAIRELRRHHLADRLVWVQDGAAALEYVLGQASDNGERAGHPMVILLDLKLPKVDGLAVLQRLKSDERTRTIPVVILSSSREEQDVRRGYEFGANSYVVKPVDAGEFSGALCQLALYWLQRNQAAPPIHGSAHRLPDPRPTGTGPAL
jgi:two-component system, response regulator